jgi:DNA (cytosine-5)-methyltransferase 1
MDNQRSTLREMALFAGAGGGILGGHLLGWKTVCAVEWEPYPACVLAARQNDKILPPFPIWDDVQTFDGRPWRGLVDVVSGGFPCQDISSAGRGAGIDGEKSSMWKHMARIVGEVRPRLVYVENSPLLIKRGAALVISDLTALGYDCQWCIVSAADCGAPHKRDRFWLVGNTNDYGQTTTKVSRGFAQGGDSDKTWQEQASELERSGEQYGKLVNTVSERRCSRDSKRQDAEDARQRPTDTRNNKGRVGGWDIEPNVGRVANGVAARVDRLKAIGNGQVPVVAATAFSILNK